MLVLLILTLKLLVIVLIWAVVKLKLGSRVITMNPDDANASAIVKLKV